MIDTIYSDPSYLEHHGVKGMHWGVRKDPESYNRYRGILGNKADHPLAAGAGGAMPARKLSRKKRTGELIDIGVNEPKKTMEFDKNHSRKKIYDDSKSMSDEALKKAVSRMNLERQYRQLMNDDARDGRSYLENKLRKFGDNTVNSLLGIEQKKLMDEFK